ncbi:hypothetical protein [Tumebacillus flagellatus]|uniref:Uncharacterized protein n=1 Tax=Tumebacillus flagellatus TaxID=1157490 RepID=A0A074LTJ8_9BACL|nr:hypothetical protein [Tumebacillus flagellatus]KEO83910.1 hypothetical protein EL26_06905 [Tumebacillus flagellatus]
MDDQFLDLLAKSIFKNVKRRRLTEAEKNRLRTVAQDMQAYLDTLNQPAEGEADAANQEATGTKRRPRLTWRRNH